MTRLVNEILDRLTAKDNPSILGELPISLNNRTIIDLPADLIEAGEWLRLRVTPTTNLKSPCKFC